MEAYCEGRRNGRQDKQRYDMIYTIFSLNLSQFCFFKNSKGRDKVFIDLQNMKNVKRGLKTEEICKEGKYEFGANVQLY